MELEKEAKRHVEHKQQRFYQTLSNKLEPVRECILEFLPESRGRDRAIEHVDDVAALARYIAELHGIK